MTQFKVSPKNLLLGVLSKGESKTIPISMITHIGELFGFSSNAMRVNVTRLLSSGALEQDERGYYRVKHTDNLVSKLIERWHIGEDRRTPWDQTWLMVCLPHKKSVASNKDTVKALSYLGFKPSDEFLWVRPHNLTYSHQTTWDYLLQLGLTEQAQLFTVTETEPRLEAHWRRNLWPINRLQKNYKALLNDLNKSQKALKKMGQDQALVESFVLGSKVVNTLAIDALLPDELMDNQHRHHLTEAMKEYDRLGKEIWDEKMAAQSSEEIPAPAHLNFL
ncbi:MAG: hypothetical protein CL693_00605 [Cellvibrionaceae bacterium]|nr:hypothetical protein [Cellvibrionaceae bacterium]|tara:strand:- start:42933 stop:43763 length:831 start_codon:yes stop_codon:yes gene_type:complete